MLIFQMHLKKIVSSQVVEFALSSANIEENSKKALDKIADLLIKYNNAKIEIEGHSNHKGDKDKNIKLS